MCPSRLRTRLRVGVAIVAALFTVMRPPRAKAQTNLGFVCSEHSSHPNGRLSWSPTGTPSSSLQVRMVCF